MASNGSSNPRRGPGLWSRIGDRLAETTPLEQALWAIVALLAVVAVVVFVSSPSSGSTSPRPPSQTEVAQVRTPTRTPTPTPVPTATPTLTPPLLPTPEPLEVPSPPSDGSLVTFAPNPERTGWAGSKELGIHWRDRNLHSGTYQGQALVSVLQLDLTSLAPGTRILFAALELTGRSSKYLGSTGQWKVDIIDSGSDVDWDEANYDTIRQAKSLISVGPTLGARSLATGQTNRFVFGAEQLALLQQQLDRGIVSLRLNGPAEAGDNLFTWDAGPGATEPTLYLSIVPGSFVVITATPTPADVYVAATMAAQQTELVRVYGTSTPFPRSYATATPGATGYVVVTSVPPPLNPATATAQSAYATAVAATTGTFTPTPPNLVTTTPTSVFLAFNQFTPVPTPWPTREISLLEYPKTPIPLASGLIGKIAFITDREGLPNPQVWLMDASGKVVGKMSGRDYYQIAAVHDLFSPNYDQHMDFTRDSRDKWEIVLFDVATGVFSPFIREDKGMTGQGVYHPAWSPDGAKIAFVSNAGINSDIWIYDIATKTRKRITWTLPDALSGEWADCKHPSWSPDGKYIVFSTNRDNVGHWQIWIMDAEGNGLHKLSPSPFNDSDPVWIKR